MERPYFIGPFQLPAGVQTRLTTVDWHLHQGQHAEKWLNS